jgi:hypothetical protein
VVVKEVRQREAGRTGADDRNLRPLHDHDLRGHRSVSSFSS